MLYTVTVVQFAMQLQTVYVIREYGCMTGNDLSKIIFEF